MGDFLPQENEGQQRTITGQINLKDLTGAFCVFDGMGGEACGEIASSISATTFNNIYKSIVDLDVQSIVDICYIMNRNVCRFAKRHKIQYMGTTAAKRKYMLVTLVTVEFFFCVATSCRKFLLTM